MDERTLLKRLSRGSERAMETAVSQFSAYVVTVVHNRGRGFLSAEDEEEIASDVFLTLWQCAGKIDPNRLRAWLGSVARNKTADRLRRCKLTVPLEENTLVAEDSLWRTLSRQERAEAVQAALNTLKPQDREIFYRYYDFCQTTTEIAAELNMPPSTVRTRLSRGRDALRTTLCQGEFQYEDQN